MSSDSTLINHLLSVTDVPEPELPTDLGKPFTSTVAKKSVAEIIPVETSTEFSEPSKEVEVLTQPEEIKLTSVGMTQTYVFDSLGSARTFSSMILREMDNCDVSLSSFSINNASSSLSVLFDVDSKTSDVSKSRIGYYAAYIYSVYQSDPNGWRYYSERSELPAETESLSESSSLTESSFIDLGDTQVTYSQDDRIIKVPFCKIGLWDHPLYGKVEFTQEDFDSIKEYSNPTVLGFEPPLFLGHPIDDSGTVGGHPADGYSLSFVQEEDVLYCLFKVVVDQTFSDVALGRYRYSSGEFVRNYPDKTNQGKPIKCILMGVALTNRPFLTGLPQVKAMLSESSGAYESFTSFTSLMQLSAEVSDSPLKTVPLNTMSETQSQPQSPVEVQPETVPVTVPSMPNSQSNLSESNEDFRKSVLADLQQAKESYTASMAAADLRLTELNAEVASLRTELTETKSKSESSESQLRETQVQAKLSELNSLTLPVEVKEKYTALITDGSLGEQEVVVFDMLRSLSASRIDTVTTQHGASNTTQAFNDPELVNPYKDTIERNQAQAKAKEQQLLSSLNSL